MCGVTIIIPIFSPDRYRIRNLNYIIPEILRTGIKVLIMEQTHPGNPVYDSSYFPDIDHQTFRSNSDTIQKSWLINISSRFTSTSHIWVVDSDFCTDFKSINVDSILEYDFIQPYHYARDLDEKETEQYINNKCKDIQYYNGLEKTHRHITTYGALSFIYRVSALQDLGGMDEQYTGWGHEDFDLYLRIHKRYPGPVIHITKNNGVHLWHPEPPGKVLTDNINRKYMESKGLVWDDVTKIMLKYYYKDWHRI